MILSQLKRLKEDLEQTQHYIRRLEKDDDHETYPSTKQNLNGSLMLLSKLESMISKWYTIITVKNAVMNLKKTIRLLTVIFNWKTLPQYIQWSVVLLPLYVLCWSKDSWARARQGAGSDFVNRMEQPESTPKQTKRWHQERVGGF